MLTTISILLALSASIIAFLGAVHLYYTLATDNFLPRDAQLKDHMQSVFPVLTRQTTMWKAWIGFNISHSLGALLFGATYGYLALIRPTVLLSSPFLLIVGGLILTSYFILGIVYWFKAPFRAIAVALLLYAAAIVLAAIPSQ